ncbi:MAG: hypothetical protein WED81_01775, partial [Rhodothermales bacterium]
MPLVSSKILAVADPLQSNRFDAELTSLRTTTLLFRCGDSKEERPAANAIRLSTTLEKATGVCAESILVVDACRLAPEDRAVLWDIDPGSEEIVASEIPAEAILNADPYEAPREVGAAGGYLTRNDSGRRELLLIFRRGVWDLPK